MNAERIIDNLADWICTDNGTFEENKDSLLGAEIKIKIKFSNGVYNFLTIKPTPSIVNDDEQEQKS